MYNRKCALALVQVSSKCMLAWHELPYDHVAYIHTWTAPSACNFRRLQLASCAADAAAAALEVTSVEFVPDA